MYHIIGLCLVQEIEKYIHSTDQIRDTIFQILAIRTYLLLAIVACMLDVICGSARSMDRAAQSLDPYLAQQSSKTNFVVAQF